jgi:uncharacterized membrane protein
VCRARADREGKIMSEQLLGQGQQVGLVVAAGVTPGTFAASMSQRSWLDQGIITGLSTGTHYLVTLVAQDVLDMAARGLAGSDLLPDGWSPERRTRASRLACAGVAAPVGLGLAAWLSSREREGRALPFLTQASWRLGVTGLGGSVLGLGAVATRTADRMLGAQGRIARLPMAVPLGLLTSVVVERARQGDAPPSHDTDPAATHPALGLAAGGAVVLLVAGVGAGEQWAAARLSKAASSVVPGSELVWRLAGHAAATGTLVAGTHQLWAMGMRRIEGATTSLDPVTEHASGVWTTPLVSGDPQSLVSWESLGREGRRHVTTFVRPEQLSTPYVLPDGTQSPDASIRTVMGEDPVAEPVAVYVGLDSAPTHEARVELALAEMDRTDAWSRSLLMLVSPTGTGYVNYVATASAQYLTRGDIATVTLQYSKRPSPLSLGKIKDARAQNRLLWLRILERVRDMAPQDRPRVVLFGESLGAHTSQDVLMGWGTLGPQALGIDRALWIGTPQGSKWRHEIADRSRPDVDPGVVAIVNDYEQLCAVPAAERERIRYVLVSHDNDGVTKFGVDLLARRPDWLGPERPDPQDVPGRSPRGTPGAMRWRPVTTFFQTLIDMKNAQVPGAYQAWAHDYRPDLPEFVRDVFGLECSDEQLARIQQAVQTREEFRERLFV